MKCLRFLTVCGIAVSAVFPMMVGALQAQTPASNSLPLILGTWKLNPDKSNLRVPANHVEIRQYRLRPDGFLVGL